MAGWLNPRALHTAVDAVPVWQRGLIHGASALEAYQSIAILHSFPCCCMWCMRAACCRLVSSHAVPWALLESWESWDTNVSSEMTAQGWLGGLAYWPYDDQSIRTYVM